jgi:hypothetical protein
MQRLCHGLTAPCPAAQSTRFLLTVNTATAGLLKVTLPRGMLQRADQILE